MYKVFLCLIYLFFTTMGYANPTDSNNLTNLSLSNLLNYNPLELRPHIVERAVTALECAEKYGVDNNHILTIIDYSLPANQKRLWVFDLAQNKLLFHTYVSHGINSGFLHTNNFSNKFDSKSSSVGVFLTKAAYYGREGTSLKLEGLERDFNDNAANRFIVMHGGWYVNDTFANKYGRIGRSWGCPAVPLELSKKLINTIKDGSLMLIFYPDLDWLLQSKFFYCENISKPANLDEIILSYNENDTEIKHDILYLDLNHNNKYEESDPVLVMHAEVYAKLFDVKIPLTRMLRRQISGAEYVVLTKDELPNIPNENFVDLDFVVPNVKLVHGYYETEMHVLDLGAITNIFIDANQLRVSFQNGKNLNIYSNNKFIRWIGL